ncbi:sugar transferase [Paenibacillus sp. FSL L8-0436]|uniref:sugar transferase n=1 Tax=Paenibacillus sp. FSL L8-0436 TaxID=2954686 RepID=UPI0031584D25
MIPSSQREEETALYAKRYYPAVRRAGGKPETLYLFNKRVFDIAASAAALLVLSPLFLILALVIKLEDPRGSVFFGQTRVGKAGRLFRIYKFRSMIADAEALLPNLLNQNEMSGPMFKMRNDPRVTRVGRFIRRTSIDELPQLVNVLKGDMSLVGPRPSLPREVEKYSEYDRLRLSVTPGCTGLWQVSGRSGLNFKQMVELDLLYIEQRTLGLDLKIMFMTAWQLVRSKNAF